MSSNEIHSPYASLGRRFAALLLDSAILAIPLFIGTHIVPFVGGILIILLYGPILESSEIRATLGKHLMGIQVSDMMGRRLSFQSALIRNLLKFVSSSLLFLGFIMALFTKKSQTLHDLLAHSIVVYGRSEAPVMDAWSEQMTDVFRTREPNRGASLADLEKLQALREKGVLSDEEFETQKKRILSEM